MSTQLSRAERRRLQRGKQNHPAPPTVSYAQWPLALALAGLFFFLSVLSLVEGAHLWYGESLLPRSVGWTLAGGIGIVSFVLWAARRKTFQAKRRWSLLFPMAFVGGVLAAIAFTRIIGTWQELSQLEHREEQNRALIQTTSAWKVGDVWSSSTCAEVSAQQYDFVKQMRSFERIPYVGEVMVLFGTVQTSYQAGCDPNWEPLIALLSKPNSGWKHTNGAMIDGFNKFVTNQKPRSADGCKMEQARIAGQKQETLSGALGVVCEQVIPRSQWTPGMYTQNAQSLIQSLKKRKEAVQEKSPK